MELTDQDIINFNFTLKSCSTYDFSDYSEKSLKRRLSKVLLDYKLDMPGFLKKLKDDHNFVENIVKDITVNTTELFRDPVIWQNIRHGILPRYKDHKIINIWHAGCSTGQEVYSLMILLKELDLFDRARIYATDINGDVLDSAKKGIYKYRFNIGYLDNFDKVVKENPFNFEDFKDVPYSKYFDIDKSKDIITMHNFLCEKPIYKRHDLVKDNNIFFLKFDIILCRNVMIYFNYKLQNKVIKFFYENMYDNGYLILGKQETIRGSYSSLLDRSFQAYVKRTSLYT